MRQQSVARPAVCGSLSVWTRSLGRRLHMAEPTQGHAGVIAPPPLLYAVPLGLGLLLKRASPAPLLPRTVARLLGGSLVAGATAVEAWFVLTMRRAATPINPRKPVARLVIDGPFRFSRNPSY